ncbi:hypothetical protein NB311A_08904 [Nitrobacter sp. Nb-311A]|uniref:hypothetical protein n=1 Tax=Nitrobacter sp. Nb-311A TaxID=314253 RepID=UPI00006862EE|nr:hypothetical protein [Nitrobacter sp. Nb-311A]EAQ33775.1 hypothetical protein NB311A_08904 [Nitrobacter sp. Nb-311A]
MSYDPETRPSVGKDVHQDPHGRHPPPAPDNMRPSSNSGPADTPNPDPGYPDQMTVNQKNPDHQQNRGERPQVQQQRNEDIRKAEIGKAAKKDNPDNKSQGQEKVGYSGGT